MDLKRIKPVPADQPIPVQDFFRPERFADPMLSPDGKRLAARLALGTDHAGLIVDELATKKLKALGGYGDEDIYDFDWLDNRHILFFLSKYKIYAEGVLVADIRRLNRCYPILEKDLVDLVGIPRDHPMEPVVWIRNDAFFHNEPGNPVRLDATYDREPLIERARDSNGYFQIRDLNRSHVVKSYPSIPDGMGVEYYSGPSGDLEYGITESGGNFHLYRFAGKEWRKSPLDLEKMEFLTFGDKPGQIVVSGPAGKGRPDAVEFVDAATGKPGSVILEDKNHDVMPSFFRDRTTNRILGASYDASGPKVVWFSKKYQAMQNALDGHFPGLGVRIIDSDDRGTRFLVATFSDRQPVTYYLYHAGTRRISMLESSRPWIDPKRMRPMQIMKFKTADGKELDAYVTLPAGTSKNHPAPLVVLAHGGPWVRDTWGFDPEAQLLASRGYAVLQPNYRGSPGYDWEFPASDQWAFRKMNDDVTQATKALLSTGYVDPKRVAVMGGSFGGYLAVAGAAFEPKLYQCAITIDGVFDWARLLRDDKTQRRVNSDYAVERRYLGDPEKAKARFDEISPIRHVDQIRIPVFVAHGKEDPIVNIDQSKELVHELRRYHVPYEEMFASGEGHGMHHLNHQVELYDRILVFLHKYIGSGLGQPTSTAAK